MANGNDTVLNSIRRGQLRNPVTGILGGLFDLVSAWNKDDEAQRNKKKVGERLKKELAKIGVSDIDEISTDGQVDWDKVEAARKRHEDEQAAVTTQTQTGGTRNAGQTGGTQTAAQPTSPSTPALNPATGAKRASVPTRAPLVSVGRNDRTGTTVTVNGRGMRPTTENVNLAHELQRRQLLDAPTGVDVTSPLYTNAEVRLMRRQAAQDQMFRDQQARLQKVWDDSVMRSNQTAWARGAVRNEDDWRHYGEVANTGGDGWKKGGKEYADAMSSLREKMKTLSGLADQGLLGANRQVTVTNLKGETYERDSRGKNPHKEMASLHKMIDRADSGVGLSQKQIEVANDRLDELMELAGQRKEARERQQTFFADEIRRRLPVETAGATTNAQVFAAEKAYNKGKRMESLKFLSDPDKWETSDFYDHVSTINRAATQGADGRITDDVDSAAQRSLRDPQNARLFREYARSYGSGPDAEASIANLRLRFGVRQLQEENGITPVPFVTQVQQDLGNIPPDARNFMERAADSMFPGTYPYRPVSEAIQPKTAPQQTLTDEERRLGIQAAQGAGDALRPRRKGVL